MKYLFYVIVVFPLLTGCSDTQKQSFDTYADLEKSGYMEKGWVPAYFPTNTCQIIEEHDLDTNMVWIEANFFGESVRFEPQLKQVNRDKIFSGFRKRLTPSDDAVYYRLGDKEIVAIDNDAKTLYYYRNSY